MDDALARILIAEDDHARLDAVRRSFEAAGRTVEIRVARTLSEFRELAGGFAPGAALVSLDLAGTWSGQVLASPPESGLFPVVTLVRAGDEAAARASLAAGAVDYLVASPAGLAQAAHVLARARRHWTLLCDHRQAEDQIRVLAGLLDVAPASITVHDDQGRFLYANQQSFDLHGYTREEFLALDLHELDVSTSERLIEPRMRELQKVGRASFEVEHRRKDGALLPLHVHVRTGQWRGQPVFFSVALDISTRRQVEQALRQSEEKYRTLFETMAQGVVYQDRHGAIVAANPAAEQILGLTLDQMSGRTSLDPRWEPIDMDGAPFLGDRHPPIISLATGQPAQAMLGVRCSADGTRRWIHVSSQPQMRPGETEPYQVFSTITDITALKLAQEEVHRLNAELEARVRDRTAQLEAAVQELEAFSYSVSHDLRAPLRAINGFAHILMEDHADQLPAEARSHLQVVSRNARTMGELIDDLLTFSRLGRSALSHHPVDCRAVVRVVLQELEPELQGRQVEFRVGELPPCQGDARLLKQVWTNLLSNALKFTRQRGTAVIEIGASKENGRSVYFVRDNGAGFDMRHAGKIFGVFERLHPAEEFEGTGVGLAIVKRIVERHGGTVQAEGKVGQGATFSFTLPDLARGTA